MGERRAALAQSTCTRASTLARTQKATSSSWTSSRPRGALGVHGSSVGEKAERRACRSPAMSAESCQHATLSNDVMHVCTPPASDVSTEMAPLAVGDLRRPLRNEYGRLGLKASSLTPPLPPTPTMLPTDESPPKRRLTPGKLPATSPTSESKPRGVFSTNPACSIISTPDMPAVNFPPRPCADISSTACRMPFLTPSDSATVSGVAPTVESSESSLPRRLAQL